MKLVRKAFEKAQELLLDPFAIKRPMLATPEVVTPLFSMNMIVRELLQSKSVIGQGQVCSIAIDVIIVCI
jgi:hypothetical protein